jgi:hypothetical protein
MDVPAFLKGQLDATVNMSVKIGVDKKRVAVLWTKRIEINAEHVDLEDVSKLE